MTKEMQDDEKIARIKTVTQANGQILITSHYIFIVFGVDVIRGVSMNELGQNQT